MFKDICAGHLSSEHKQSASWRKVLVTASLLLSFAPFSPDTHTGEGLSLHVCVCLKNRRQPQGKARILLVSLMNPENARSPLPAPCPQ